MLVELIRLVALDTSSISAELESLVGENGKVDITNESSISYIQNDSKLTMSNFLTSLVTLEFEEKITDKREIESLAFSLREKPFKLSIKKEDKTEAPPLAYNLLNLQSEASKLFGFSAKKTLDITQKLREEFGAITYNRSDCQYLPESVFDERYELLECLKHNFGNEFKYDLLDMETKSKVFDDSKLSAHYGIIPTQAKLDMSRLNQDQKAIYRLIAQRFLLQFATKREYESINLQAVNGDYTFSKTLNFTQKEGFRDFLGKKDDDNQDESDKSLREVIKNLENRLFDEVHIENMSITTHITKPPAKYSVTTLLKDLNQVSKYVKKANLSDENQKTNKVFFGMDVASLEMVANTIVVRKMASQILKMTYSPRIKCGGF